MTILLNVLVCFGLVAVGICFFILLPTVGQTLVGVFSVVLGEQSFSFLKREESGTVVRRVDNPPALAVAEPIDHDEDDHHHEPASLQTYVGVYGALLLLTVATVGVSELGMVQRHAIFWALVVASAKASLVIAWFMHVKGGPSSTKMILSTTAFFMVVFFAMTMSDLGTRTFAFTEEGTAAVLRDANREGRLPAGWSEHSGGPTFTAVDVSPKTAFVGTTLTCSASATDINGDITYRWSDGTEGTTYNVTRFDPVGTDITCTVSGLDDLVVEGSKMASATVVPRPDPS